jgi:hypothetical protein
LATFPSLGVGKSDLCAGVATPVSTISIKRRLYPDQGCQMVYFETKNPTLGKFWRALDGKMLQYLIAIWNILRTLGICHDLLVHFVFMWYIFPVLVSCAKKNLVTLIQIFRFSKKSRSKTHSRARTRKKPNLLCSPSYVRLSTPTFSEGGGGCRCVSLLLEQILC